MKSWFHNAFVLLASGSMLALAGTAVAQSNAKDSAPVAAPKSTGKDGSADFSFRFLGPVVGNRISAFSGTPGDHATYYAGAASGGIFKTTNGGQRWVPVFDKQNVAAIGALAVAPSEPNTVWAGTGEAWAIRDIDVAGDGVYKTTDGGKSWTNMGLHETGRIGRILVDPSNANNVWVCALGRLTGPQQDRGVYHTVDGGKNWTRSLFVDANTGCSGISMDAKDHNVLYAGTWQVEMHTWAELSGGPGSGLYKTVDGGAHWTKITDPGLPKGDLGKIDMAVAPSNSNRVYALIQTNGQGSLWRSDDAGTHWKAVSWDRRLIGRAGYYLHLAVSPTEPDRVIVTNSSVLETTDGGPNMQQKPWGGDTHDIWWDAKDPTHFAISQDGGVFLTTTNGNGGQRFSYPVGQMYHVEVDNQVPYYIYTNMQDNSTMRGPSIPVDGRPSDAGWDHKMGGCESGFTLPDDPSNPTTVYASCYGNEVTTWDIGTKKARSVSPWLHTLDAAPNEVPYRCHWTPPLAVDPFDPKTVYYGCQVVFKTVDRGQSWKVASPDLSHGDPKYIKPSGGIVGDNLGQFAPEVVFAIAPSKVQKGLIWAGTNDGKVWYSTQGGDKWVDVSAAITGMPPLGTVTSIQPSLFDPATAYVTFDAHLLDDRDPYIFKTTDFGKSWTKISGGLPKGPLAYVRNVSEDPYVKGLLFAGTGNKLYYSPDDGGSWTELHDGLPGSPVGWTVVQKNFHDLVISTYGRGIYILDDITPIEAIAKNGKPAETTFFAPRQSYLLKNGKAFFNYWLPAAAQGKVKAEVLDDKGEVVRTLLGDGKPGLNRIAWDYRYDHIDTVQLRTIPPENPHIWESTQFKGQEWRPVTHWGMAATVDGPTTVPGQYQVRLTIDGKSYTQPLTVLNDPKNPATTEELKQRLGLQLRLSDGIGKMAAMINVIEWQRHGLDQLRASGNSGIAAKDIDALDQKLQSVEYEMLTKDLAASDDKYYISAYKPYFSMLWLNGEIGDGAGDVAGGADMKPTDTAYTLVSGLEKEAAVSAGHYQTVQSQDVAAFNKLLAAKGKTLLPTSLPAGWQDLEWHSPREFFYNPNP